MGSITFQIQHFYVKGEFIDQLPNILLGTAILIGQSFSCYLLITYYKIQIVTSLNQSCLAKNETQLILDNLEEALITNTVDGIGYCNLHGNSILQ